MLVAGAGTAAAQPAPEDYVLGGPMLVTRGPDPDYAETHTWVRDTSGKERPLVAGEAQSDYFEHSAVWSPDGSRIAFVRQVPDATSTQADIFVVDADGTDVTRITSEATNDENPEWSPDGTQLVFDSRRSGHRQLYVVTLSTLETRQLTSTETFENYHPTWSPNGSTIIFSRSEVNIADADLWHLSVNNPANATVFMSLPGNQIDPAFSPDGTKVVYNGDDGASSLDGYDISYATIADRTQIALTNDSQYDNVPRWMPAAGSRQGAVIFAKHTGSPADGFDLYGVYADGSGMGTILTGWGNDKLADIKPLVGCTALWDGGAGTNSWHDAANWEWNELPDPGDTVCIPDMNNGVTVTHSNSAADTSVASIKTSENLALSGGTLNAGTITLLDGATASLTGGSLGSTSKLAGGTFVWDAAASVGAGGTLTIDESATLSLEQTGYNYTLTGDRRIVNQGTMLLKGVNDLGRGSGSTATIRNDVGGEVVKSVNYVTTISLPFDNDGTLQVLYGTVNLRDTNEGDGHVDSGSFTVSPDAFLTFAAGRTRLAGAHQLYGTGTFTVNGGTLDVGATGLGIPTTLNLTSGALVGSGTLGGGTLKWNAEASLGDSGTWTIAPDTTLSLEQDGYSYNLRDGRQLVNKGTIALNGAHQLGRTSTTDAPSTSTMANLAGAKVTKNETNTTLISLPFDNDGALQVTAGTIDLRDTNAEDGHVDSGTFDVASGAKLNLPAGVTKVAGPSQLTGAGSFTINGGTLDVGTTGFAIPSMFHLAQGALVGSGTLSGGTLKWNAEASLGGSGTWTIAPDATLSLEQDGHSYNLLNDRQLVNEGTLALNGVYQLGRTSTSTDVPSTSTVTNVTGGKVTKNETNPTLISLPFDNDGTVQVTAGAIDLRDTNAEDGHVDSGTFEVAAGAKLNLPAGVTKVAGPSQLTGAGTFTINGGTLDVGTTGLAIPTELNLTSGALVGSGTLSGGTLKWNVEASLGDSGTWTIAPDSTLSLQQAGYSYNLRNDRQLVNNGTIALNGAYQLGRTTTTQSPSTSTLTNAAGGKVTKDAANATTIALPMDNQGTVDSRLGTLVLPAALSSNGAAVYDPATATFTSSGTYNVVNGAKLQFSGTMPIEHSDATLHSVGLDAVVDSTGSVFRTLKTNAGSLTFGDGSRITTTSGLTNTGTVTLVGDSRLTAPNYTQSGTAEPITHLTNTASRLVAGVVTLESGTLKGDGTVEGALVNNGGTIAPGNSPGTLSVTGDFTQTAGGTMSMEVNGTTAGSYDALEVAGTAKLGGALALTVDPTVDMTWQSEFSVVAAPTIEQDPALATTGVPSPAAGLVYEMVLVNGAYQLQAVDKDKPSNASSVNDVSHALSTWSKDQTVEVEPQGAHDAVSGIAGYAVVWDNAADTVPAAEVTHDTPAIVSPVLTTGKAHYVHLRAVDGEGNWADETLHVGPYFVDASGPTAASFASAAPEGWNPDAAAAAPVWAPGTDEGEGVVDGYAFEWTQSATPGENVPGDVLDASATTVAAPIQDGTWYLHLWSKDKVGNWGGIASYGPVRVDGTDPATPTFTTAAPATWATAHTAAWTGNDGGSGISGYAAAWTTTVEVPSAPAEPTLSPTTTSMAAPSTTGTHYLHLWAFDAAGRRSAAASYGPVQIDRSNPTGGVISSPTTSLPYSVLLNKTTPQVKVTWSMAKDVGSDVKSVTLLPSTQTQTSGWVNGKAIAVSTTATSKIINGTAGTTYCFKVRVTDAAGNSVTSAQRCAGIPIDGDAFTHSKGWNKSVASQYYLGSASQTSTAGATLTKKSITARSIGIVASKCSTCGSVVVLWNGKQVGKAISLKGSGNRIPIHVGTVAALGKTATGTLTVKATTSKPVTIDALAVATK